MDGNTTVIELQSALNINQVDKVAEALRSFHPTILGQLLRAVDKAYRLRVRAPHPDYVDAVRELTDQQVAS